jgi:hypothetical protein
LGDPGCGKLTAAAGAGAVGLAAGFGAAQTGVALVVWGIVVEMFDSFIILLLISIFRLFYATAFPERKRCATPLAIG